MQRLLYLLPTLSKWDGENGKRIIRNDQYYLIEGFSTLEVLMAFVHLMQNNLREAVRVEGHGFKLAYNPNNDVYIEFFDHPIQFEPDYFNIIPKINHLKLNIESLNHLEEIFRLVERANDALVSHQDLIVYEKEESSKVRCGSRRYIQESSITPQYVDLKVMRLVYQDHEYFLEVMGEEKFLTSIQAGGLVLKDMDFSRLNYMNYIGKFRWVEYQMDGTRVEEDVYGDSLTFHLNDLSSLVPFDPEFRKLGGLREELPPNRKITIHLNKTNMEVKDVDLLWGKFDGVVTFKNGTRWESEKWNLTLRFPPKIQIPPNIIQCIRHHLETSGYEKTILPYREGVTIKAGETDSFVYRDLVPNIIANHHSEMFDLIPSQCKRFHIEGNLKPDLYYARKDLLKTIRHHPQ